MTEEEALKIINTPSEVDLMLISSVGFLEIVRKMHPSPGMYGKDEGGCLTSFLDVLNDRKFCQEIAHAIFKSKCRVKPVEEKYQKARDEFFKLETKEKEALIEKFREKWSERRRKLSEEKNKEQVRTKDLPTA